MRARRRQDDAGGDGEHHVDERWMASYMDMVTVLMCMFIVLFGMSSVDQGRFQKLKESLATGFGVVSSETVDTASGAVVPPDEVVDSDGELTSQERAEIELAKLEALRDQIKNRLAKQGLSSSAQFTIDDRGLTIRLVGAETFFASNSTALTTMAKRVMSSIEVPLGAVKYPLSIEGHADPRAAGAPFATNWELSSLRATAVLRDLVERGKIVSTRVGAIGYGAARPISKGSSPSAFAADRRVDIVVLSDQPEAIRALIPGLVSHTSSRQTDNAQG